MSHRLGVAALVVLLAAGCTGRAARPALSTPPSCASAPAATPTFTWPAGMPADLSVLGGARVVSVQRLPTGFTVLTFTSPGSLRDNLRLAIARLQQAGYAVGRGVVSSSQSRLPFSKAGRPGVLELSATDGCGTRWRVEA